MRIPFYSNMIEAREYSKALASEVVSLIRSTLPKWAGFNQGKYEGVKFPELVKRYKGEIYSLASKNAQALAQVPLRLYTNKPVKDRQNTTKVKSVSRDTINYLGKHAHLTKYISQPEDIAEITDHPFLTLMRNANSFLNGFEMFELLDIFLELTGNSYWLVVKNDIGVPSEIWPLPAQFMRLEISPENYIEKYCYGVERDNETLYEPDQIVHFKLPNPHDIFLGMGPVQATLLAGDLNVKYDEFNHALIDNNCVMPFVLETDEPLSDRTMKEYRQVLDRMHRGSKRAGRFGVFHSGLKYKTTGTSPKDMDFLAGQEATLKKLARAFDIPWSVLSTDNVNLANAQAGERQWMASGIRPRCIRVEQKINEKLMPMYGVDGDDSLFCAFDNPVPEDKKAVLNKQTEYVKNNIMSINEVRAQEGLEPVSWGDVPLVQSSIIPLGSEPPVPVESQPPKEVKSVIHQKQQPRMDGIIDKLIERIEVWLHSASSVITQSVTEASVMTEAGVIDAVNWGELQQTGVATVQREITSALVMGSNVAISRLPDIGMAFDLRSPEAVRWAAEHTAKRITVINQATREAIRETTVRHLSGGMNPRELQKEIRGMVGLNQRQAQALSKFKMQLTTEGQLSANEVNLAAGEYREKLIKQRSEMIARTETAGAYAEGEIKAYQEGGIAKLKFNAQGDACSVCLNAAANMTSVAIAESHGVIPWQTHPNCRCNWLAIVE